MCSGPQRVVDDRLSCHSSMGTAAPAPAIFAVSLLARRTLCHTCIAAGWWDHVLQLAITLLLCPCYAGLGGED
jgi:hypothetical protein